MESALHGGLMVSWGMEREKLARELGSTCRGYVEGRIWPRVWSPPVHAALKEMGAGAISGGLSLQRLEAGFGPGPSALLKRTPTKTESSETNKVFT